MAQLICCLSEGYSAADRSVHEEIDLAIITVHEIYRAVDVSVQEKYDNYFLFL